MGCCLQKNNQTEMSKELVQVDQSVNVQPADSHITTNTSNSVVDDTVPNALHFPSHRKADSDDESDHDDDNNSPKGSTGTTSESEIQRTRESDVAERDIMEEQTIPTMTVEDDTVVLMAAPVVFAPGTDEVTSRNVSNLTLSEMTTTATSTTPSSSAVSVDVNEDSVLAITGEPTEPPQSDLVLRSSSATDPPAALSIDRHSFTRSISARTPSQSEESIGVTRQRSDSDESTQSTQSTSSVFRAMARRISINGYENDFANASRTRQERTVVNGKETTIRRTFGKYENGFQGVGWVEDADVSHCMICNSEFDRIFLSKHHCRACGNIICHKCSPKKALVEGIEEYGAQRVCIQCHWGQELVPTTSLRTIDELEDDEDPF